MKKIFEIINPDNGKRVHIHVASTFWERFRGLMGTKSLPPHTGLILMNCNSIHMCFMRYPLDIVYVDEKYRIVKLVENLKPWRINWCLKARHTLEVPVGTIRACGWKVEIHLKIKGGA